MSIDKPWLICVFIDSVDETIQALEDLLNQSVEPYVLGIDNGSSAETWTKVRRWAEDRGRLWLWRHNPSLPSLAATWNYALDFVWSQEREEAMVVNHDVRVSRETFELLSKARTYFAALLVSAVGVLPEQFDPKAKFPADLDLAWSSPETKGGPDFSCYLISKACHEKYRFDENFIPCYCEDLDFHRRLLLSGNGKNIFSINVPFAHFASGVLKSMSGEKREALERRISEGSRAYYDMKWGGPVNHETGWNIGGMQEFDIPEADRKAIGQPTTPNLQRYYGP